MRSDFHRVSLSVDFFGDAYAPGTILILVRHTVLLTEAQCYGKRIGQFENVVRQVKEKSDPLGEFVITDSDLSVSSIVRMVGVGHKR